MKEVFETKLIQGIILAATLGILTWNVKTTYEQSLILVAITEQVSYLEERITSVVEEDLSGRLTALEITVERDSQEVQRYVSGQEN